MRTLRRAIRAAPIGRALLLTDLGLIAWRHLALLNRRERRRLAALIGLGLARRGRLPAGERRELRLLVAKLRLRMMIGTAVKRVSPVPMPRRLLFGPAKRSPGLPWPRGR